MTRRGNWLADCSSIWDCGTEAPDVSRRSVTQFRLTNLMIVNFGSLNIDHVYHVDHFARPGETIASTSYSRYCGGKGLNQSIALARAGANVVHAGRVGSDGDMLCDRLRECGVDVRLIQCGDVPTGHAIIQVTPGGENCIIIEGGANRAIGAHQITQVLSALNDGDWLLLQNEISSLNAIFEQCSDRVNLAFNPAPMTRDVRDLDLGRVHTLFVNEVEGAQLSRENDPREIVRALLQAYPRCRIVLTRGTEGAVYADLQSVVEQEAFPVAPVDTTAAGDTFIGFYLAAMASGVEPEEALRIGCKAASISVTRHGAADSIPDRSEVQ